MPEQIPLKDPRFKGKRYEIQLEPGDPRLTQESAEICGEKIAAVERSMADFERTFDIEALHAITGFSSREERIASIRQPALQTLIPIFTALKILGSQEAVPDDVYAALQARYQVLNLAVGTVTTDPDGKFFELIVHDR